jgi:polyhydroxybutyrate depolymerase
MTPYPAWLAASRSLTTLLATSAALAVFAVSAENAEAQTHTENVAGREAVVYRPKQLPPSGARALVVVLHGGLGNARRIAEQRSESALNLNAVAEENGFVVAYLNGTPVARLLGDRRLGWNAGNCCGQPVENQVDDVAYVQAAVAQIAQHYGIERSRIFGVGHSNGAMMTQRLLCETTLYASGVSLSGTLENGAASCPAAYGKRLLALHGADDQNVPTAGGRGSKGLSRVAYASQEATGRVWQASGAQYLLQVVPGADHAVDSIDAHIQKTEGQTLAQKIARFFGLAPA